MKVILLFIWLVMVFTHYSYAQATDTITIKTFAKENPVVQFNYREPANYDITLKSKYRLLIYFGGRNTTGENEVKSKSWGNWCDKNGVFLIVPSYKNDNYW